MKISSPIGQYDYHVERVALRGGQLEVTGRLGQWETTTIVERSDLAALLRRIAPALAVGCGLVFVTRRLKRV